MTKRWGAPSNEHHKYGRVRAEKICRERNWGSGTVIDSTTWMFPRRILRVNIVGVTTQAMREGVNKVEELNTFPGDVHEVEE